MTIMSAYNAHLNDLSIKKLDDFGASDLQLPKSAQFVKKYPIKQVQSHDIFIVDSRMSGPNLMDSMALVD